MEIELVRAGTFGGVTVTPGDLQELVSTFKGEVPITLGHSLADFMPAFGWVRSVKLKGDSLWGEVELNDLLKSAFEQGLYKKWSVGIRRDPETGKKYLHHVAFLGAVPPKIKDLKLFKGEVVNMGDVEERWIFAENEKDEEEKPDPPPLSELEIVDVKWDHDGAVERVLKKYGFKGLKAYSLYQDPDADPETKSAYKFLVVDIINGEPKIVAKALSASFAYLHGARGVKIDPEVRKVVEPKLKRLLKKKEKEEEEEMSDVVKTQETKTAEVKTQDTQTQEVIDLAEIEVLKKKVEAYEETLKALKRKALEEAIQGKVPKALHPLVFSLADSLDLEQKIEFSDGNTKKEMSAIDLLIEIFKNIPLPVTLNKVTFADEDENVVVNKLFQKI
ncbi:MAG: hypothetical protein QXV82_09630 [Ignisphaera sp.]